MAEESKYEVYLDEVGNFFTTEYATMSCNRKLYKFFSVPSVSAAPPSSLTLLSFKAGENESDCSAKKLLNDTGIGENNNYEEIQKTYHRTRHNSNVGNFLNERIDLSVDRENDAFTGIHENYSSRSFRCIQFVQTLTVIVAVCSGLLILLYMYHNLRVEYPLIFYYVVFTLSAEALLFLWVSVALLSLSICVGEHSSAHANAICAVSVSIFQGMIYYASLCIGIYVLNIFSSYLVQNKIILLYIFCEVILSLIFTLRTLPLVYGGIIFILRKLHLSVSGAPEVTFRSSNVPTRYYSSISQYERTLNSMTNPAFPQLSSVSVISNNEDVNVQKNISMVNM